MLTRTIIPAGAESRLLERTESRDIAAQQLRNQLRRQMLALSTYTITEPVLLLEIRQEASDTRIRALRERAESDGAWQALAEEYDKENQSLKRKSADLEEELGRAQAQVDNLSLAFRHQNISSEDQAIPPESEPSIHTVVDAVEAATDNFATELIFGDDVIHGANDLAEDAGPPDKVYDYLRTLAEMTRARNTGGLGKDVIIWLTENGARASNESETVLNSNVEMNKRTWSDGRGRRRFERHLKPTDRTSPDRCVRIYFDYDESIGKTIVGWVGRHP